MYQRTKKILPEACKIILNHNKNEIINMAD